MLNFELYHANIHRTAVALLEVLGKISYEEDKESCLGICEIYPSLKMDVLSFIPHVQVFENGRTSIIAGNGWQIAAQPSDIDLIAIKKNIKGRQVGVIEIYWRPWSDVEGQLFKILSQIMSDCFSGFDVYLMGDINTENPLWSMNLYRQNSNLLVDVVVKFNLKNCFPVSNDSWSYQSKDGNRSCIDIIFCSRKRKVISATYHTINSSNHRLLKATFDFDTRKSTKEFISFKRLSKLSASNSFTFKSKDVELVLMKLTGHISNLVALAFVDQKRRSKTKISLLMNKRKAIRRKIYRLKVTNVSKYKQAITLGNEMEAINNQIGNLLNRYKVIQMNKYRNSQTSQRLIAEKILGKNWSKLHSEIYRDDQKSR